MNHGSTFLEEKSSYTKSKGSWHRVSKASMTQNLMYFRYVDKECHSLMWIDLYDKLRNNNNNNNNGCKRISHQDKLVSKCKVKNVVNPRPVVD